ncbi:MAG: hypothetical protein CSA75_02505 [Sorangium cellulosum]|nr:MAG: hypothetical protein CSA75_02505 [Sorangium cellulosum]
MNRRAPSHEDLMLYADGELDPERVAEVESYLEQSQEARDVVATIFEIGDVVRLSAEQWAKTKGADDIADRVIAEVEKQAKSNVVDLSTYRPGSIWPVALGGLAAAAAVALIAWRFAGLELAPTSYAVDVAASASAGEPEMVVASAHVPISDDDPEPTVSVDAIDFGARTGTIFYVPSDTGTTTVVWLTDDEAGGD